MLYMPKMILRRLELKPVKIRKVLRHNCDNDSLLNESWWEYCQQYAESFIFLFFDLLVKSQVGLLPAGRLSDIIMYNTSYFEDKVMKRKKSHFYFEKLQKKMKEQLN
ncbi:Cadherin-5 [Dirofilaria immitis]